MALEFKLSQKLSHSLVMTPQLQHAIKLLNLGRLDYLEMIANELEANPVLESIEEPLPDKTKSTASHEIPQELNLSSSSGVGAGSVIENTVGAQEGLSEHLLWQLRMGELAGAEYDAAVYMIGNLDVNGYLSIELSDVAQSSGVTEQVAEAVLAELQSFDPIGIAARDFRECLLLQLEYEGDLSTLAWKIVDKHLSLVEFSKLDDIALAESVELESVIEAVGRIRRLEPRPARPFLNETPIYITPDVYVRRVGDEYVVSVNDHGIPKLRLNPEYKKLLETKEYSKDEGDYLKEKAKAAAWLIKSVDQRQQTIYRVTESIMRYQGEFLELGVSALKPLILKDIAADVGLHQSTISRITTNKYVHTPQGVYELKFFFSSRLRTEKGVAISSESVRKQISELIAQEDSTAPLSDQSIANVLAEQGIEIARRTVAKYRESLGILSSSRRKNKF